MYVCMYVCMHVCVCAGKFYNLTIWSDIKPYGQISKHHGVCVYARVCVCQLCMHVCACV